MNTENKPGSVDDLSRLYREIILQHSSQAVGFQKIIKETCRNEQFNPLCGDRVVIMLQVEGEIIRDAAFDGESCAICKASASLLCELTPGGSWSKNLARRTTGWSIRWYPRTKKMPAPRALHALLGVRKYPSRIECVTLPWTAAAKALLQ